MTRRQTQELGAQQTTLRPTVLKGRVWVLRDARGQIIDDIDTDMIFHNAHLAETDFRQMGQHALGNLFGHEDFSSRCATGDIVLAGRNFGSGSSRQQAVDCFLALGCVALLAESFGAIYRRNAINAGFPLLEAGGLTTLTTMDGRPLIQNGDELQVNLRTGEVTHCPSQQVHRVSPMASVQMDIYQAGNLFALGLAGASETSALTE